MSTAAIVKACVILMGIGIMIVTFVLHASCEKEADRKPGSYLGTAWNCSNLKRSGSEIFRMEQPDRAWEPRCSSDHSASGSVGRLPDDNSDLFPVNEKPGTGDSGFSFEPGE